MEKTKKQIFLSETKSINLCDELAHLTCELKQDEHVECIYFAAYKNYGNFHGRILNLTVVLDTNKKNDLDKQYQDKISREEQLKRFGVKIVIDIVSNHSYTYLPLNPSERRVGNDIFNSRILFDRTGMYTKIKEVTESIGIGDHSSLFYYKNRAELFPPIDERLEHSMVKTMNKSI